MAPDDHPRRRPLRRELMDELSLPPADADRALRDLERVNRWTLGLGTVLRAVVPRLAGGPAAQRLIDLGAGSGQVSAALVRAAHRHGVDLRVVAVDRKLDHLLFGARQGVGQQRVVADARALPFRDAAVDWTLSCLLFHHFDAEDNRSILAEMRRVAHRAAAVVDLRRSPLARLLARLLLPLLRLGHVARYDGQLSVDQAWTVAEVRDLLAGERPIELRPRFPLRFSLFLPANHNKPPTAAIERAPERRPLKAGAAGLPGREP